MISSVLIGFVCVLFFFKSICNPAKDILLHAFVPHAGNQLYEKQLKLSQSLVEQQLF